MCVDCSKSPLTERFSAEFSNLNLVEVLAEFSLPSSLREHIDALSARCQQVTAIVIVTIHTKYNISDVFVHTMYIPLYHFYRSML